MINPWGCRTAWLVVGLLLAACGDELGEREQMRRELDRHRASWEDLGIVEYALRERVLCFCVFPPSEMLVTVQQGRIVSLVDAATGAPADTSFHRYYYTIEGLFDLAQGAIRDADGLRIAYDATYFFPIEIAIDWVEPAIDDEITVQARALEP